MVSLASVISLTELIKNRSGPFSINCGYLSHYLSVVGVGAIGEFCSSALFGRANFIGGGTTLAVRVIPVFALACLIWG